MRAWERLWLAVAKSDKIQLLWNVEGRNIHSVDRIPDFINEYLLSKCGDHLSLA